MSRWLRVATIAWVACAVACGTGLIVAATNGAVMSAVWAGVGLVAALGTVAALAIVVNQRADQFGRHVAMSCLVPGCVEPVEDHPPFCADHDWADFATADSPPPSKPEPVLQRMAVYVDVKPDPHGRPAVLLQLPDGFVLLPNADDAQAVAMRLVEAAEDLRQRQEGRR